MSALFKRTTVILCLICCGAAKAAAPGAYVGAGLGESKLETSNQALFATSENSKKRGGLGGRAFAGYNFNQYLGLEAGFTRYAKSKYTGSMNNDMQHSSLDYSMNAFDLVAKTYLPVGDRRLNVYALGGIAAVNDKIEFTDGGVPFLNDIFSPSSGTRSHRKVRPIYGVGVGYDIPKSQFTASMELTRIQGLGNVKTSPNATPPAEMVSFTLSYNFN